MGFGDLFWLIFFAIAMQPFLRQKFLEIARQKAIEAIEKKEAQELFFLSIVRKL